MAAMDLEPLAKKARTEEDTDSNNVEEALALL